MSVRKLFLLSVLAAMLVALFAFDVHDYLSLSTIKARQLELAAWYQRSPLPVLGAFMLLHISALALSLPGAVLTMALAGGAIFGPVSGTLVVLVSLTIGDSLGFLIARYLFRDWLRRRFEKQMPTIEQRVERDGAFYLLSARLTAVIPFFAINLTMALTRMPLRTFAPVSFIGLVPATVLYVNAGTDIARVDSRADVLSFDLAVAFLLLALVPFAFRWMARILRR